MTAQTWAHAPAAGPAATHTHALAVRVFLRALAVVSLLAFASLGLQIRGLVGERGILPVAALLSFVRERAGPSAYTLLPTAFWWNASDPALVGACLAGVALSTLLLFDVAPALALAGSWIAYLSLCTAGQEFLGYQWDNLLLETLFLALLVAPWRLGRNRGADATPSPVGVWLLRWLTFRLMFSSGAVKLLSGDAAWRGLTALAVHYETQPLPTPVGWLAHQLPAWFQATSVVATLGIELVVPFAIFGPRRARLVAAAIFGFLQLLIALTGNYAFFNLLAAALCLPLLDDAALRATRRGWLTPAPAGAAHAAPRKFVLATAGLLGLLSLLQMSATFGLARWWPAPLVAVYRAAAPWRTVNGYGLFAVMTTSRPEIEIEGTADGVRWTRYEFRYKPGDLARAPAFVAPHQPRLDWQMWFAALGSCQESPWLSAFMAALLEGSPAVVGLLTSNPFPHETPRAVRAMLYDYRFSGWGELRREGHWWRRELRGPFCPVMAR